MESDGFVAYWDSTASVPWFNAEKKLLLPVITRNRLR
jgi:GH18 family chitinase